MVLVPKTGFRALLAIFLFAFILVQASDAFVLGNFFGGALPGDVLSPQICEKFCRNKCLSGGFSGSAGVPGCNQFCDCDYYLPPPYYYY